MNNSSTHVILGDCLDVMRSIPTNSVDSVVTDPPYAFEADGSSMAGQVSANFHESATHSRGYAANCRLAYLEFSKRWLAEVERVLKPGGHLVAFGGNRTQHNIGFAAEEVGLEVRDHLIWATGMARLAA